MEDEIPYLAIGHGELDGNPPVGKTIKCPHCGEEHEVKDSNPPGLQFYNCGEKTYLCGIDGTSLSR
jgi:hypothetical protein